MRFFNTAGPVNAQDHYCLPPPSRFELEDILSLEDRVRRVIEPLLAGESLEQLDPDNLQYVEDLGLIHRTFSGAAISNAIYREIIPRELTYITQVNFESTFDPAWYILPDGKLDMENLLSDSRSSFGNTPSIG